MSRARAALLAALLSGAACAEAARASVAAPSLDGYVSMLPSPEPEPARPAPSGRDTEPLPEPSDRRLPYLPFIEESSRRHGVDAALIEAIMACESNFNPAARSKAGACGLMQLMPHTARRHGCTDPHDVRGNIDAGTRHLAELLEELDGDRRLVIAAYNAGLGAVRRAGGVPNYTETRRHVLKVEHYLSRLTGEAAPPLAAPRSAPAAPAGPPLRLVREAGGRLLITNLPLPPGARVVGGLEGRP